MEARALIAAKPEVFRDLLDYAEKTTAFLSSYPWLVRFDSLLGIFQAGWNVAAIRAGRMAYKYWDCV
jgi:hypothetical protein